MDKFVNWMSEKMLPIAAKIAQQRDLAAIKDGFTAILPIILVGSFAVLLNSVVFAEASLLGSKFYPEGIPFFTEYMVPMMNMISGATMSIFALILVGTIAFEYVKHEHTGALPAAVIAISAFLVLCPASVDATQAALDSGFTTTSDAVVTAGNVIPKAFLGATSVFAAMMIALIVGHIYSFFLRKKLTIKMPESVPPAVAEGFAALTPGVVILMGSAAISLIFLNVWGTDIFTWINEVIQKPFMALTQGPLFAIIYVIAVDLLWFFGIHGSNVLAFVNNGFFLPATIENANLVAQGLAPTNIFTDAFFYAYVWIGGSGATLALLIAILGWGKRPDDRAIAKLAISPAAFEINEPVIFGLPIVLNALMFIPFIVAPVVLTITAYIAHVAGLVPYTYLVMPWTAPVGLGAFIATGGSWAAMALALFNLGIAIAIYYPFILVMNKVDAEVTDEAEDDVKIKAGEHAEVYTASEVPVEG